MDKGLIKTILISLAIAFFLLWIFEANRTDLQSSYWLLLLSVTFLLVYQYYFRLKGVSQLPKKVQTATPPAGKPGVSAKKKKK